MEDDEIVRIVNIHTNLLINKTTAEQALAQVKIHSLGAKERADIVDIAKGQLTEEQIAQLPKTLSLLNKLKEAAFQEANRAKEALDSIRPLVDHAGTLVGQIGPPPAAGGKRKTKRKTKRTTSIKRKIV